MVIDSRQLLARALSEPSIVTAIPSLAPEVLRAVVARVGVEDAGELLALATTDQLLDLLDAEVWTHSEDGLDERFDPERFGVWLEVLSETGAAAVAERLTELPFDLVAGALHSQMLVLDTDDLGQALARVELTDADRIEKALDGCLCLEFGDRLLIARGHPGWDALLDILTALDRDHHELLSRLLDRLQLASSEHIEDGGGLYEVLTSAEMLEADAAAGRSDRRAGKGYVARSDARAFLELCRSAPSLERDPITAAHLRDRERAPQSVPTPGVPPPAWVTALGVDLAEAPRVLPHSAASTSALVAAMHELAARDPVLHGERLEELAYLANVVAVGAERRRGDAVLAVVEACDAGLDELASTSARPRRPVDLLAAHPADVLFRFGSARRRRAAGAPGSGAPPRRRAAAADDS